MIRDWNGRRVRNRRELALDVLASLDVAFTAVLGAHSQASIFEALVFPAAGNQRLKERSVYDVLFDVELYSWRDRLMVRLATCKNRQR
jgi:hypothetical protein